MNAATWTHSDFHFMDDQPIPARGPSTPTGSGAGVPLLVPASEFGLLVHALKAGAALGVLVLGDGDVEAEQLVVVGLARSAYEAWTIVATGKVPPHLNVAQRDPSRLIAASVPADALPGPDELQAVQVRVTAFDPSVEEPEATVPGWYLLTPGLAVRRWRC